MPSVVMAKHERFTKEGVGDVLGRVHRNCRDSSMTLNQGEFSRRVTESLGVFRSAKRDDPILAIGGGWPYTGVEAVVGFKDTPVIEGAKSPDQGGIFVNLRDVRMAETPGDSRSSEPTLQLADVRSSNHAYIKLLGGSWAKPLTSFDEDLASTRVGLEQIQSYVPTLRTPYKFAALTALAEAGVEVDCELDREDAEKAKMLLSWAIARFAVYHSDGHASKYGVRSIVAAARVLHPNSDTTCTEPRSMISREFDYLYQPGLQRALVDTAIDWIAGEIESVVAKQQASTS